MPSRLPASAPPRSLTAGRALAIGHTPSDARRRAATTQHVAPLPSLATESRLSRAGTPAYMAPETLAHGRADARSDQFSWALGFFEAIYGYRLDPRRSRGSALGNRSQRIDFPARAETGERVPAYVRDVLVRALATDPRERASTLAPLVASLRGGPSRIRRRRAVALAATLMVAAGGGAYVVARSNTACPSADGLLDGTWDATIAARVEAKLLASQQPFAKTATAYTLHALDEYSERWRNARVEACELTRTRAQQSEAFLALANACLETRRAQLHAVVEQLDSDGEDVLAEVTELVGTLAPADICINPSALEAGREAAFDLTLSARFDEIRDALTRARLAFARGYQAEALRLVDEAVVQARESEASLIIAEAMLAVGTFRREMGDGGRAREMLLEALDAAEAAGAPSVKAAALIELTITDAELTEQLEHSTYHLERARATLARIRVDPEGHVPWLVAKAARDALAGDVDAAGLALNRAIVQLGDDAEVEVATLVGALARYVETERPQEARRLYDRAESVLARLLGEEHPRTLGIGFNRGLLDQREGELDRAAAAFERMRAAVTSSQGADAPRLATVHTAMADLANVQGDPERALEEGARALAIEASLPFEEPTVMAAAHTVMSNAQRLLGNTDGAFEHALAAYEIQRTRLPPRDLVQFEINLGEFLCAPTTDGEVRRCGEARPYYAAAAETVRSATDARGRIELAYAMNGLGKVGLFARAYAEAASSYLVAREIGMRELDGTDAALNAEVHWGLAQARAGLGARAEADAHAVVAFAACAALGQVAVSRPLDGRFTPSPCKPTGE